MVSLKVGCVRTSKKDQNPDLQRRDLSATRCEKIFEEQISSRKADRPELRAALEFRREGDELVVWKLDRFGRSLKELAELVNGVRERGIEFVSPPDLGLRRRVREQHGYGVAAGASFDLPDGLPTPLGVAPGDNNLGPHPGELHRRRFADPRRPPPL